MANWRLAVQYAWDAEPTTTPYTTMLGAYSDGVDAARDAERELAPPVSIRVEHHDAERGWRINEVLWGAAVPVDQRGEVMANGADLTPALSAVTASVPGRAGDRVSQATRWTGDPRKRQHICQEPGGPEDIRYIRTRASRVVHIVQEYDGQGRAVRLGEGLADPDFGTGATPTRCGKVLRHFGEWDKAPAEKTGEFDDADLCRACHATLAGRECCIVALFERPQPDDVEAAR